MMELIARSTVRRLKHQKSKISTIDLFHLTTSFISLGFKHDTLYVKLASRIRKIFTELKIRELVELVQALSQAMVLVNDGEFYGKMRLLPATGQALTETEEKHPLALEFESFEAALLHNFGLEPSSYENDPTNDRLGSESELSSSEVVELDVQVKELFIEIREYMTTQKLLKKMDEEKLVQVALGFARLDVKFDELFTCISHGNGAIFVHTPRTGSVHRRL